MEMLADYSRIKKLYLCASQTFTPLEKWLSCRHRLRDETSMKIVSYNIHYAIGKDDRYDLRTHCRHSPRGRYHCAAGSRTILRQPAKSVATGRHRRLAARLLLGLRRGLRYRLQRASRPTAAFSTAADNTDRCCSAAGRFTANATFRLPRIRIDGEFNMQMGVLEGIIETPLGWLRIYNLHLRFGIGRGATATGYQACSNCCARRRKRRRLDRPQRRIRRA